MAEPLLSYADIIGMNYIPADAGIVLSAAEQTLAVQAVACFGFSEMWSDYDTSADDIEALVASTLNNLLTTEIPPPVVGMDSDLCLYGINAVVKVGNPMTLTIDAAQRNACVFLQSAAANGDKFQWRRFMAAGDWSYRMTYLRNTDSGQLNVKITSPGGTELNTTLDLYGALQRNSYFTGTFTITEFGRCDIDCEITGKNASSSAYLARISCLELWRTAAP